MKKIIILILSLLIITTVYAEVKVRAKITGFQTSRTGNSVVYYVSFKKGDKLISNDIIPYTFLPDETKEQFKERVRQDLEEKCAAYENNKKICDEVGQELNGEVIKQDGDQEATKPKDTRIVSVVQ